jgi:hypothetical protein
MKTLEEGTLKPSVLRRWGSESCHGFLVPLRAEGSGSVPSIKISSYHRDVKENYSAIPFTDKNDVPEILNNDEEELNKIFHMHYEELNNWLNE